MLYINLIIVFGIYFVCCFFIDMGIDREKEDGWEGEEIENRVEEWVRREEGGKSGRWG